VRLANQHNLGSLNYTEAFEERNIAWCSFLKPGLEKPERRYEEVADWAKVQKLLRDYLDDYNSSHTNTLDLVFFQAAVDHVCRLCRVLQQVGCARVCVVERACRVGVS
jgi:dynein heavy chain